MSAPSELDRQGGQRQDLSTDPRSDPRAVAALARFGLATRQLLPTLEPESPLEEVLQFGATLETAFSTMYTAICEGLPVLAGVTSTTRDIPADTDRAIAVSVHRPDSAAGLLPGIVYCHSGGMAFLSNNEPLIQRWYQELALAGLVIIGVEFRNAAGRLGPHPFPAGLDDCVTVAQWVHEHRGDLGISTLIVAGDSGGGNLALATGLRLNVLGGASILDGVYVSSPHISGMFDVDPTVTAKTLPSLAEFDGYFTSLAQSALLARMYDPGRVNRGNPLCWPYRATVAEVRGSVPHVIVVSELDSVRDEGLAFAATLAAAGVSVSTRIVPGVPHDTDIMFERELADLHRQAVTEIQQFATNPGLPPTQGRIRV